MLYKSYASLVLNLLYSYSYAGAACMFSYFMLIPLVEHCHPALPRRHSESSLWSRTFLLGSAQRNGGAIATIQSQMYAFR